MGVITCSFMICWKRTIHYFLSYVWPTLLRLSLWKILKYKLEKESNFNEILQISPAYNWLVMKYQTSYKGRKTAGLYTHKEWSKSKTVKKKTIVDQLQYDMMIIIYSNSIKVMIFIQLFSYYLYNKNKSFQISTVTFIPIKTLLDLFFSMYFKELDVKVLTSILILRSHRTDPIGTETFVHFNYGLLLGSFALYNSNRYIPRYKRRL